MGQIESVRSLFFRKLDVGYQLDDAMSIDETRNFVAASGHVAESPVKRLGAADRVRSPDGKGDSTKIGTRVRSPESLVKTGEASISESRWGVRLDDGRQMSLDSHRLTVEGR